MKYSAHSVVVLLVLCLAPVAGRCEPLRRVIDPIFGLGYDPAKTSFEAADDLAAVCRDLTNSRWSRRLWIFANATEGGATYTVVGGLYVRNAPARNEKKFEPDPKGAVLRRKDSECELIGPAREVFDYPVEGVAPNTLQALARDAVRRYSEAFGGKQAFRAALARAGKRADLANPRSSILRDALQ